MSTLPDTPPSAAAPARTTAGIDPRGPRAGAAVTTGLLLGVLLAGDTAAGRAVLAVVVALFVTGVWLGPARSVLGLAYRTVLAPRLAPPTEREDPRPPRFAQALGLLISAAGLSLALLGVPGALTVAASLALVAAFLNAAFGVCLGCELYLTVLRLRTRA